MNRISDGGRCHLCDEHTWHRVAGLLPRDAAPWLCWVCDWRGARVRAHTVHASSMRLVERPGRRFLAWRVEARPGPLVESGAWVGTTEEANALGDTTDDAAPATWLPPGAATPVATVYLHDAWGQPPAYRVVGDTIYVTDAGGDDAIDVGLGRDWPSGPVVPRDSVGTDQPLTPRHIATLSFSDGPGDLWLAPTTRRVPLGDD